ncbi:autotransporter domain-containing SGNH/GDSL hydrolase family protein [Thermomonas sp.]|uniref:autotransporter domain-containing protein n=1 Tax=Thermomonas sp. TaxID=1971895 RepID=UPI002488CE3C|nr:autotransporter domain-containing SGNH/GDSL hydrolase family protein [Thermomonas sp.]MDI1251810.1 autotransporter domain-containing protein [Thermomonas sp.]
MKAKFSRTVLAAALALAAMPLYAQNQPTFTQTVFFGDSLTDGGYFRPLLPLSVQAVTGQFTTNPGLVWSQYLADYYGSNADSAWFGTGAGTTPGAGNNWAVGGARAGQDSFGALGYTPSMASQVTNYLSRNGGHADPGALYTVWGGANDLFAVQANPANAQAIIGGAVAAQVGIVGTLTTAGAKYILVPTIPDLGLTPSSRAGGAVAMAQGTALTASYNNALFGALASANMRVIPLDTFHFLQEIVTNPSTYGIVNVTGTACLPPGSSSLTCNPTSLVSPNAPYDYAFADGVHPTTGSHKMLAQFAESVIEGPRQIAILPHSEATIGRARTEMLSTNLGNRPESDGMRWWASALNTNQRFGRGGTADGFDGDAPSLNGGMQWAAGNLTYGAFGAYGKANMDWGMRRGNFKQTDTTLGGFVGWYGDGPWANAQLSYTWLNFDVKRDIVLGPAVRTHYGSANGSNLTAAGSAGWTFTHGMLSHGPVLGLVSQRIDVNGFAESAPAMSTSLAYPSQSFNSLVGSIGWQASLALGEHITPYAKLTWDREFEKPAAEAFAMAQSMPGTQPYAVPGLVLDREYGTAQFGVRSEMFGMDVQTGTRITVNQDNGNNATFFVTVARKF